ncbi:MAG: hypothetical protein ACPGC9_02110 [Cytophagales bacterium]
MAKITAACGGNAKPSPLQRLNGVSNLKDARYLPFEGMGATFSWQLDMPEVYNYKPY